jgi:putative endopeptidase
MDVDPIDAKGMTVLAGELAAISAIHNTASLSAYLGATLNSEVDGLTANADHIFGVFVNQGFEDSKRSCSTSCRAVWDCPVATPISTPRQKAAALREKYRAHIAAILKLAEIPASDAKSERVLALESRIAQAHAPDADAADVFHDDESN